jgi:hypothetical protein
MRPSFGVHQAKWSRISGVEVRVRHPVPIDGLNAHRQNYLRRKTPLCPWRQGLMIGGKSAYFQLAFGPSKAGSIYLCVWYRLAHSILQVPSPLGQSNVRSQSKKLLFGLGRQATGQEVRPQDFEHWRQNFLQLYQR